MSVVSSRMGRNGVDDLIRLSLTVPAPREVAFEFFWRRFAEWYPPEFSWSGAALQWIGIEGREGGRCFERGPHDFQCDWGRVLEWQPPERIAFTWQIGFDRIPVPDPAKASEIEVRWSEAGPDRTDVEFIHREFRRHGSDWAQYLEAMASPGGWQYILERYVDAASGQPSRLN